MSQVTLKGWDAINYAAENNLRLNSSETDYDIESDQGISIDEARVIAENDPEGVWLEIITGVNQSDVDIDFPPS